MGKVASLRQKIMGTGYLVLNALRFCTMITLLVTMAASWAKIVVSGMTGHFAFFDTASNFFVFLIAVFLFISEMNLKRLGEWFDSHFPVFNQEHSLAWLGVAMVVMGCQNMGDLIKSAYTIENLTLAVWRLVISAGILCIAIGVMNLIVSLIYRDPKHGITARMLRKDGTLSLLSSDNGSKLVDGYTTEYTDAPEEKPSTRFRDNRFTRLIDPRNYRKSKIQISSPIAQDMEYGDDRRSPVLPHVTRPATALHPAYAGVRRSADSHSMYSTAHVDRF